MILPEFVLPTRANQHWCQTGTDSRSTCLDKKHFDEYPHKIEYRYNSRGFRDNEWPLDIGQLKKSIWCIGDSCTAGIGSPVEHTWPYLLGKSLGKNYINVSMDGASNAWMARKFQELVCYLQPEVVCIQWSFLHRREHPDSALSDEFRALWFDKSASTIDDYFNFFSLVDLVESCKNNTRVFHSIVPNSGLQIDSQTAKKLWDSVRGSDWPSSPPTNIAEFGNLPEFVIKELVNLKLYDLYNQHATLCQHLELITCIHQVEQVDYARDHMHYDIKTATTVATKLAELISQTPSM